MKRTFDPKPAHAKTQRKTKAKGLVLLTGMKGIKGIKPNDKILCNAKTQRKTEAKTLLKKGKTKR
ncbi:hypothetical protein [Geomonas oryzae]|uniref:hypothetical protein n=1 Tax=Geomonas oryzae TaxID=2364273 RepID=UPI00100AC3BC|nr:hypothetical protein [Geomonas oryzae]